MTDALDPQTVLNPNEYKLLVAPVLQVVTEIAAKRGDPQCFNDLPSMVAIMALSTGLSTGYWKEWGGLGEASEEDAVMSAPLGACVMVLQNAGLQAEKINDMVLGLANGFRQLVVDGVVGSEQEIVQGAWRQMVSGDMNAAREQLKHAAMAVVIAVETWEDRRDNLTATRH
jgi:hypothetical protein